MKVFKKPPEWNKFNFIEKLKWYAKKDNEVKNVFANKYKIKQIIDEMELDEVHYANIITHVPPIKPLSKFKVLVSLDQLLKMEEYQMTDEKLERLCEESSSIEDFWDTLKNKYDIIPEPDDYVPPKFYVIKLNLGWNTMVFVRGNEIIKMVSGSREFKCETKELAKWRKHTYKQYTKKIPPQLFIEEFIGYNLKVYEVYCIYGKPRILSIYFETDVAYENNYLIIDETVVDPETNKTTHVFTLELQHDEHLIPMAEHFNVKIDYKLCKKICDYAENFSRYFEFVRMDFYYTKGKVFFSECTFKPGALKKIRWGDTGKILSKYWTKENDE